MDTIEDCWFCGETELLLVIDDDDYGAFAVCADCADDPALV